MSKIFFITTIPEFGHMVIAYAASFTESEAKGADVIIEQSLGVDPENIDTNEVQFVFDDDGVVEMLVRVDGGRCVWSLCNDYVKQLASDVRAAGLI